MIIETSLFANRQPICSSKPHSQIRYDMVVTIVLYLLFVTPTTRTQGFFNPDSHDIKHNSGSEDSGSRKEKKVPEISGRGEKSTAKTDRLKGEFVIGSLISGLGLLEVDLA